MTTPWTLAPDREQTVLLPFDFSSPAIAAITTSLALVARPELLWILHVIPPVATTSPGFLFGDLDPTELRNHADAALAKQLDELGVAGVHRRIAIGDPAEEIILAAAEIDANLIVMPSRGKTGLRRWMIGSVAEKVVRQPPCPVLILPIRDDGDDDEEGSA